MEQEISTEKAEEARPTEDRELSQAPSEHENAEFSIFAAQADSLDTVLQTELSALSLEHRPILSIDDIVEYSWERHEIRLTPSANFRLARLQGPVISNPGLAFVVCVGSERIYRGAFWSSYSSVPFDGHVIDLYPAENEQPIRIQIGYPTEEWFTGEDMRDDPRIYTALMSAGKLR
jgi:hypothetical protein